MKLLIEWENGSLILEPEYTYILGRDETSDIHIDSPRISRAHARLSYKNKEWILEDLESSNGTFVGNKPVKEIMVLVDRIKEQGLNMSPKINFHFDSNEGIEHQYGNTECGIYSLYFIVHMLEDKMTEQYLAVTSK